FFLGSGCSFPSGQPSVHELTHLVLYGKLHLMGSIDPAALFIETLRQHYPLWGYRESLVEGYPKDLNPWRRPAESIQVFLRKIADWEYWSVSPNYEDLSGLLRTVSGALYQGINDPLVECIRRGTQLDEAIASLEFPEGHNFHDLPLSEKICIVEDFIGWVLARRIENAPELRGYESIIEALDALRSCGDSFEFATTNYDCNIEQLLRTNGIEYSDGFSGIEAPDDCGRTWRVGNEFRFTESGTVPVLKLHGSTNWFGCYDENGSGSSAFAVCEPTLDSEAAFLSRISIPTGHIFTPKQSPQMMRGSLSKASEYSYGIHSALLAQLELMMERSKLLVIAGFGWSDEALVARFIRYAHRDGKSLLVLDGSDPDPALANQVDITHQMVGGVGEGRPISLHRAHMSDVSGALLADLIQGCL
ncbi:MAG: SIR2 family protein, partial [Pirellulales bacterium]|nr:SIR2 family protein [Pirellulales bacterium]